MRVEKGGGKTSRSSQGKFFEECGELEDFSKREEKVGPGNPTPLSIVCSYII